MAIMLPMQSEPYSPINPYKVKCLLRDPYTRNFEYNYNIIIIIIIIIHTYNNDDDDDHKNQQTEQSGRKQ